MEKYGLSAEQYEHISATFKWFDKNCDGKIDVKEIGIALRLEGQNPTDREIQDMVDSVDKDRDGIISFDEYMKMMADRVINTDTEKSLRAAFEVFDKNGDGRICSKELIIALTSVGEKLSQDEVKELMKNVDLDKNGTLCYNEFVILMTDLHPNESD